MNRRAFVFTVAAVFAAPAGHAQSRSPGRAVVVATMLEPLPRSMAACGYFYVLSARRFRIDRVESGAVPTGEIVLVLRCPTGTWQSGHSYRLTISRERPSGIVGVRWMPRPPRGATTWWVIEQHPMP